MRWATFNGSYANYVEKKEHLNSSEAAEVREWVRIRRTPGVEDVITTLVYNGSDSNLADLQSTRTHDRFWITDGKTCQVESSLGHVARISFACFLQISRTLFLLEKESRQSRNPKPKHVFITSGRLGESSGSAGQCFLSKVWDERDKHVRRTQKNRAWDTENGPVQK